MHSFWLVRAFLESSSLVLFRQLSPHPDPLPTGAREKTVYRGGSNGPLPKGVREKTVYRSGSNGPLPKGAREKPFTAAARTVPYPKGRWRKPFTAVAQTAPYPKGLERSPLPCGERVRVRGIAITDSATPECPAFAPASAVNSRATPRSVAPPVQCWKNAG